VSHDPSVTSLYKAEISVRTLTTIHTEKRKNPLSIWKQQDFHLVPAIGDGAGDTWNNNFSSSWIDMISYTYNTHTICLCVWCVLGDSVHRSQPCRFHNNRNSGLLWLFCFRLQQLHSQLSVHFFLPASLQPTVRRDTNVVTTANMRWIFYAETLTDFTVFPFGGSHFLLCIVWFSLPHYHTHTLRHIKNFFFTPTAQMCNARP
jgi:hypothetical protein